MKTIQEIIDSTPVFLNNWKSSEGVIDDFELTQGDLEGRKVLFASYGTDNYSGEAFVLSTKDGKLYETYGSHCSCYGLEGQWRIEEVVLEEMKNRLIKGQMGTNNWSDNVFAEELKAFLGIKE